MEMVPNILEQLARQPTQSTQKYASNAYKISC
jgi:hypothetical protein